MAKRPGLDLRETDLSTIVRGGATSTGALVLWSKRGPFEERTLVGSTKEFRDKFGAEEPTFFGHYTAISFLAQSEALYVYRTSDPTDPPNYGGVLLMDESATDANEALAVGVPDPTAYTFVGDETLLITGENPGDWNSSIRITCDDDDDDSEVFILRIFYPDAAGNYAQVEEDYRCSRVRLKKDGYGKSMYVEDVINGMSAYIRVQDNTAIAATTLPKEQTTVLQMESGDNGTAPSAANIAAAWDTAFSNKREVSVQILMAGGYSGAAVGNKLSEICGKRQDCVAILDSPNTILSATAIAWRDALSLTDPSYCMSYFPWAKDTDETNALENVELPPSGYVGAVFAKNDKDRNVWDAPYGKEIGVIPVTGLTVDVTDVEMEALAVAEINAIVNFPGTGTVVWGGRTLQPTESARSWINVRRLLNYSEQANIEFLETFIGKNNTEFRRLQVKQGLEALNQPLIGDAFYDVLVVCDGTNNTAAVIDRAELAVDIYVQPVRPINRIQFQVVITRTGVSLVEVASGATV